MSSIKISYFHSFEEQVSYFSKKSGIQLPRMTCGKANFFQDLTNWMKNYGNYSDKPNSSYILPDPVQGLSFPSAIDVLSSALSISSASKQAERHIYNLLDRYGLPEDKATQPVVSLSGGELLLLNYAKAEALMPSVKGIVACSPVFWLNKNRYKYWKRLVEEYKKNDRIIDIALLNGEPFPNSNCTDTEYSVEDVPPIEWTLKMEQLEILFDAIEFPTYHPESTIQYVTNKDSDINLKSPTLLTGDNGVGKSIFAKILSGIIKPTAGNFSIHSPSGEGTARLLFQDSIDQLFGKSIDGHFDWVFLFDRYKGMLAKKIYDEIDFSMRIYLKDFESMGLPALGSQSKRNTLLQTKISLISERLASLPSVLILDEPGWGLSRTIARKLIEIVSQQASRHNIAVLLISQQPDFWNGIIHSHLHFAKDPKSIVKIQKKEI